MKVLYTPVATAGGGREGHVKSSDADLDVHLRLSKEGTSCPSGWTARSKARLRKRPSC